MSPWVGVGGALVIFCIWALACLLPAINEEHKKRKEAHRE